MILTFIFLAFVATVSAVTPGVVTLSTSNFAETLKDSDQGWMVKFYAPWCGHCKKLAPEYAEAASTLLDEGIKLGKVDCTTSKKLHNRYKIDGFPTMHFFKYGKQITYTGGNKKDSIVQWLRRHALPSTTELSSIQAVQGKLEMMPVLLVGYFPSSSDEINDAKRAFYAAAETQDHLNFFHTHSAEVAKYLGLENDGITILKKYDEERNVLQFSDIDSGEDIAIAVKNFAKTMTYPLVSVFSKERAREIFSPKIMTHVLVFTDPESDHHSPSIEAVTKIAKQFRGLAQVISIEATDDAILKHFQVDEGTLPAIVVMDVDLMERYPYVPESSFEFHDKEEYDRLAEHVQSVVDRDL